MATAPPNITPAEVLSDVGYVTSAAASSATAWIAVQQKTVSSTQYIPTVSSQQHAACSKQAASIKQ